MTKKEQFSKQFLKKNQPDMKTGDIVKVHQKIKEGDKTRTQIFEGVVLALKHGRGVNATFTVRKIISGVGTEKIFPLHSPNIAKVEIVSRSKVRRAKLYYLRNRVGKKTKLKRHDYVPGQETLSQTAEAQPKSEPVQKKTE